MEVKKDIKNELMQRREVSILEEFEKIPSFEEAKKIIVEKFKANEENVLVENVLGKFGRKLFLIKASIYDNKELKEKAEKRMIKVKKSAGESAPAA
jgi:ribosomal protein S24E